MEAGTQLPDFGFLLHLADAARGATVHGYRVGQVCYASFAMSA
jgi:hypothetical protein